MESYISHWNDKFLAGAWGRYPPEELVRFIGRNYKNTVRNQISVLEIGCGPGANIWFLHREGYRVSGIDGSQAAIESAKKRIFEENAGLNQNPPDLKVGNFSKLPWEDESFDVVIDIFSLYANKLGVITETIHEVNRVLKPNGKFFSKVWGTQTTGFGTGMEIEYHTFDGITTGPCSNMGMSHFFDTPEIERVFSDFKVESIDRILRTDSHTKSTIEELVCTFSKVK